MCKTWTIQVLPFLYQIYVEYIQYIQFPWMIGTEEKFSMAKV